MDTLGIWVYNYQMILYCLTFPNGKKYVGISSRTLTHRWKLHKSQARNGSPNPVHKAMNHFGSDSVELEILKRGKETYIKLEEIRLIAEWKLQDRRFGYNVTAGGDGQFGTTRSLELRKRHSIKMSGEGNPMFGKPGTRLGIPRSRETNTKQSISMLGKNSKLTDDQVEEIRHSLYPGKDLAVKYGVSEGHISSIKSGRRRVGSKFGL